MVYDVEQFFLNSVVRRSLRLRGDGERLLDEAQTEGIRRIRLAVAGAHEKVLGLQIDNTKRNWGLAAFESYAAGDTEQLEAVSAKFVAQVRALERKHAQARAALQ